MKLSGLITGLFVCAALGAAFPNAAQAAPPAVADGVYTGGTGMTLYTFDKDVAGNGKSVCNDACAVNWPPFLMAADDVADGDFSVVVRDDGKRQWAAKGKPLYYWIKDQKTGDRSGDGVNNVWHVARP